MIIFLGSTRIGKTNRTLSWTYWYSTILCRRTSARSYFPRWTSNLLLQYLSSRSNVQRCTDEHTHTNMIAYRYSRSLRFNSCQIWNQGNAFTVPSRHWDARLGGAVAAGIFRRRQRNVAWRCSSAQETQVPQDESMSLLQVSTSNVVCSIAFPTYFFGLTTMGRDMTLQRIEDAICVVKEEAARWAIDFQLLRSSCSCYFIGVCIFRGINPLMMWLLVSSWLILEFQPALRKKRGTC